MRINKDKIRPCIHNIIIGIISQTIQDNSDIDFFQSQNISEQVFDRLIDNNWMRIVSRKELEEHIFQKEEKK